MTTVERFWSKVRKADGDGCWEWTGARDPNGYGRLWNGERMVLATRFSLALAIGGLETDKDACHRCDNPPCVRPDHLFAATHRENLLDRDGKGRQVTPSGIANPRARLTPQQVAEIKTRHAAGELRADLARAYGVSWNCIRSILVGRTRRNG